MKDINTLRKKMNTVIAILTIIIIGGFSLLNAKQFEANVFRNIISADSNTIKTVLNSSESNFQTNFVYKNRLIDIYGIAQNVLQKNIIGNFEYVSDDNGIIHAIKETPYNTDRFIGIMEKLSNRINALKMPFIYVQGLNREVVKSDENIFNIDNDTMTELVAKMDKKGINTFDIREDIKNKELSFDLKNAFLHTDLHMQTDAEIWAAKSIANHLQEKYNLKFSNLEYLSDMSNYEKQSFKMIGNYARLVGNYYVEKDSFDQYIPKFETSYTVNLLAKNMKFDGDFESVIMNGYEKGAITEYTYWVTNYLRYGEPLYRITNNKNPNGPKLLIVTDSIGYRTLSYLSLTASEITVLDPRFFGGIDFVEIALKDKYDAALVYQGTFLTDYDFEAE
jgi:hypothetical protein